jgi:NAD-dependent dihydropyrimidine dehydrogenase PreA subunit
MSKIVCGPRIDKKYCDSCGNCYNDCPMDVFGWDKREQVPTVDYPGECTFCCVCEIVCPERAVDVRFPLSTLLDFGIDPQKTITSAEKE